MTRLAKPSTQRTASAYGGGIIACGLLFGVFGCTLLSSAARVDGYRTQKRIVWQGTLTVDHGTDIVRLIYFGYDRNGDLQRLSNATVCRGVDLLEYKCRLPDGHWDYRPFLIIADDNFDCYAERALYDCDGDGVFEDVRDVSGKTIRLEVVNAAHRDLLETDCLDSRRPQ